MWLSLTFIFTILSKINAKTLTLNKFKVLALKGIFIFMIMVHKKEKKASNFNPTLSLLIFYYNN